MPGKRRKGESGDKHREINYKVWSSPSVKFLRWRVKDALQHLSDAYENKE